MNPSQTEIIPVATNIQPDEGASELIKLFYLTGKTFPILNNSDLTDESSKRVLNTFAGYESSHISSPFSINNAKDVTANLIDVSTADQNPKYHGKPQKFRNMVTKIHDGTQRRLC